MGLAVAQGDKRNDEVAYDHSPEVGGVVAGELRPEDLHLLGLGAVESRQVLCEREVKPQQ